MQDVKILLISQDEIKNRLAEINKEYGIDATLLIGLLTGPSFLSVHNKLHGRKAAKRKLRRYLKGSSDTFNLIAEIIQVHKQHLNEQTDGGYLIFIKSNITPEEYLAYLSGKWTVDILRIVSIAQKKFGYGARPISVTETRHRVSFQPRSEYQGYFNR